MSNILIRVLRRLRRPAFIKQFHSFGASSGIGSNGLGKGCKLSGTDAISIGEECFFGEGTELVAMKNHFSKKINPSMVIGNHVRCVGGCRITCAGRITLSDDVLLGPDVFITDHNHGMDPNTRGDIQHRL